jgi:amino acid transporter
MFAINILSKIKEVPSLQNVPDNTLMALLGIAGVFILFFLYISFLVAADFVKTEQKEHKAPDSHKLIMDLQHTLIQEMKGTSKQNALMINLTIIFILITVVGMIVSIVGPAAAMDMVKKGMKDIIDAISQLSNSARGLKNQ